MKKLLFFFFLVHIFYSCVPHEVAIIKDKRLEIKGAVIDNENQPLINIPLTTFGIDGNSLIFREEKILGIGSTAPSGDFSFISLDSGNSNLVISVNAPIGSYFEDRGSTHFINFSESRNITLDLGQVILQRKIDFKVNIVNTSGTNEVLEYLITYKNQEQIILLGTHPDGYDQNHWSNIITIGDRHNLSLENETKTIPTLENSEVSLSFKIGENGNRQEIVLTVTADTNTYDLFY